MRKIGLIVCVAVSVLSFSLGMFTGRYGVEKEIDDARDWVVRDLEERKLDPGKLGATELLGKHEGNLRFGFSYSDGDASLDYVLEFSGPHGVEASVLEKAQDK